MKRREFVRSTALGAIGVSLLNPIALWARPKVTHLKSEDLTLLPKIKDDYAQHFMAVGDWGRNGEYDQSEVARQMGAWGAEHPLDFVISAGDNFYPKGVASEFDPLWHYSFENIYTAHSLQCDWYPVLGNHDYHSDIDAQIRYGKISRRWDMPARYYAKELNLIKGQNKEDEPVKVEKKEKTAAKAKALLIFLDTDPFLHESKAEYVTKQLAWLNGTLKDASADVVWKIVIGHHPFYTVGPRINNYDTLTMRSGLKDIFEQNKVDIYLSGHEHSLQHLKPDGYTHQFISGAGSELTSVTAGIPYSRFQASENGFMYFSLDEKRINVKAINVGGKILYETELTKQ
ncbi:MAG TPA: metallophosphoesterase [Mucilaginibacter sp.]|jgi:predicted phosphodiesterase|nr:metallophosphoesterase [Mucilaginibacter sp.]